VVPQHSRSPAQRLSVRRLVRRVLRLFGRRLVRRVLRLFGRRLVRRVLRLCRGQLVRRRRRFLVSVPSRQRSQVSTSSIRNDGSQWTSRTYNGAHHLEDDFGQPIYN
jgi:hypothetical protein